MAVVFDIPEFKTQYHELALLPDAVLQGCFDTATLLLDNTKNSLVGELAERKQLLYLLTAHLASLQQRGSGTVGVLTSASEGKISASFAAAQNANWYQQTQYGWAYWQATAKYRLGGRLYGYCSHHRR